MYTEKREAPSVPDVLPLYEVHISSMFEDATLTASADGPGFVSILKEWSQNHQPQSFAVDDVEKFAWALLEFVRQARGDGNVT